MRGRGGSVKNGMMWGSGGGKAYGVGHESKR